MKPSTLLELAGFGCACVTAFLAGGLIFGLGFTAGCLLLIGYATEDAAAGLAVARMFAPLRRRAAKVRLRRQNRRFRRNADRRRQQSERKSRWQRPPAEIVLRVKGD